MFEVIKTANLANLKRLAIGLSAVLFVFLSTVPASAASTPGQGLEISPPLINLQTDPSKTVTFDIRLRNITANALVASAEIDDFVAQGETGQAKLLIQPNAEPSPYSFKSWVEALPDLTIAPQETKTATVTLNVPKDASPGGHYGVIRFTATAPELQGTGVSLSASIGTLVLLKVSGQVNEKADIISFYASQNGKHASLFQRGPINFTERLQNKGNVHFKPIGTVRITNTFGRETGVLTINSNGGNVLPASVRRFDQTLNKKFMIGLYTAEANIQFDGHNLKKTIHFWVIPYKLIAIALGILILLFVIVRTVLRRYVQQAVKRSTNNKNTKSNKKK